MSEFAPPPLLSALPPTPFPVVFWGKTRVAFYPKASVRPAGLPVTAVLVFAMEDGKFVVADIVGRGWCIPGGRLEAGETEEQAARREAHEETGTTLGELHPLGHYVLVKTAAGTAEIVPVYRANVTAYGPLPPETESRGICTLAYEELPERYFLWDELIAAVFAYVRANG